MFNRQYYVYIMTSENNSVLYVGVTGNIVRRVYEHKNHLVKGFTDKYNVTKLVYYEETNYIYSAIDREKQIKGLLRYKKLELIKSKNPMFEDLYPKLLG